VIRRWLSQDFLREVTDHRSAPGLVVQRSPGYRDVLRIWRHSLLAFSLLNRDNQLLRMNHADLSALYELWCTARVARELEHLLGEPEGSLVTPRRASRRLEFNGELKYPDGTRLYAQRRYKEPGGPAHEPDIAIELPRPALRGAPARFLFLLDAKYRLRWQAGEPREVQDAVNAMHRYRDAILEDARTDDRARRKVYGGAILFPHPDEERFEAIPHSSWHRMAHSGIGAIPLVPSQGKLLRRWLTELVLASANRLDRAGPRYAPLPPPQRSGTVLLGVLRYGTEQLQQIEEEAWYHLPARFDLADHRPTHLAIYESAVGTQSARVSWLWPIQTWHRVSGAEIRQRSHFNGGHKEAYWLIKLKPMERELLESPIQGYSWAPRGPTFIPLEIFDLAPSTLYFREHAAPRHLALLRLLHHLYTRIQAPLPEGWRMREPILINERRVGWLQVDSSGLHWEIRGKMGQFPLDLLHRRPASIFHDLRQLVD
jgi:hypothetical protein